MSLRIVFVGIVLAASGVAACSSADPPLGETPEGVGGAGGSATGAAGGAPGTGGSSPADVAIDLALVSPPPGMAFERRWVDLDLTVSVPVSGSTLVLERAGSVIEERPVEATENGSMSLRLPLLRGETPFVITLKAPDGESVSVKSHLHGGRLVAAALDMMIAAHEGAVVRWGGGDPTLEMLDAPAGVTSVAASASEVFALDADGHVYVAAEKKGAFEIVPGLEDVVAIAPGSGHALFLRADGKLFGAGTNDRGQLGVGDAESHPGVIEISAIDGIVAIAASNSSSFAVGENGDLFAWGSNDEGQLGLGDKDGSPHPVPLVVPNLVSIKDVAAGRDHVLAVTAEGRVYAWGLGSSGQLGDGSSGILASKAQPVPIELSDRALTVAARGSTSYAVLASGELVGWGQNSLAQLGVGDTSPRTKPALCLVGDVRAVGAGSASGLAIDGSAALYTWGSNASGQLGLPLPPEGPARSSVPVAVAWP